MALPIINASITPSQLYPDRIRVNYQYRIGERLDRRGICNCLRERGFERISDQLHFRGSYTSEVYGSQISAFISIPAARPYLNVYVDINPLSSLHAQRDEYGGEVSLDNRDNWLHPRYVGGDNRRIWDEANALILINEHVACDLAEEIARDLGRSTFHVFQGISVDRLELTCDFAHRRPVAAVSDLRAAFQSAFASIRANDLPDASLVSERLDGNVQILHGDWRAGTCFRLYPKTNRRLRLECEVRNRGFRNLHIPRSLERHDYDFAQLFSVVSGVVAEPFNSILSACDLPSSSPRSGMDLATGVASSVRDQGFAMRVIEALATNGRVTSRMGGVRIRRLHERGYLHRVRRGLYRISDEWRPALSELQGTASRPLRRIRRRARP